MTGYVVAMFFSGRYGKVFLTKQEESSDETGRQRQREIWVRRSGPPVLPESDGTAILLCGRHRPIQSLLKKRGGARKYEKEHFHTEAADGRRAVCRDAALSAFSGNGREQREHRSKILLGL